MRNMYNTINSKTIYALSSAPGKSSWWADGEVTSTWIDDLITVAGSGFIQGCHCDAHQIKPEEAIERQHRK